MIKVIKNYVFNSKKSDTIYFPFFDSKQSNFCISTINGNGYINSNQGNNWTAVTFSKMVDFTQVTTAPYSINYTFLNQPFTGNLSIKLNNTTKDVYSIGLFANEFINIGAASVYKTKFNIQDIEKFFKPFSNLYSVIFQLYNYQTEAKKSIIKGDLSRFPDSVERVVILTIEVINVTTDIFLNFSNYSTTSKLKVFSFNGGYAYASPGFKVIGDLGKLPKDCYYFYLTKASNVAVTYTAGKIWASSFDRLFLPFTLTKAQNDNILRDMANSITTAIGSKNIRLLGTRSTASNTAVTYLQSLGFTVAPASPS